MTTVIIFCQAPADVKYALALREKYKKGTFYIFTVNVREMYDFLSTCGVEYEALQHLPVPPPYHFRKVWRNLGNYFFISKMKMKSMRRFEGAKVYFFSSSFDWVTNSLVNFFSKKNEVFLLEHDSHHPEQVAVSLKDNVGLLLLRFITATRFFFGAFEKSVRYNRILCWRDVGKHTQELDARIFLRDELLTVVDKYQYALPVCDHSILIFDEHLDLFSNNSDRLIRELLESALSNGYKVFVKFHPRKEGNDFYKEYDVAILPKEVPGEFFPLKQFDYIFSFCSTALAEAAKQRKGEGVYSLFRLVDFSDKGFEEMHAKLLIQRSEGFLKYINSMAEVKGLLKRNRE